MAKDKLRVKLSQCVGKICAFISVGKRDEAREWAGILVQHLKDADLLPSK